MMKQKFLTYLQITTLFLLSSFSYARTVVAIDAGHGGKDPGAIGKSLGLKEKDITLSISRELKSLLDADTNFKGVMTRNGDYFIQLTDRTEIARKNRANYLVSIHADSSPNSDNLKGASVWVLSNRRANDELGKWLEDHEKQSELLGGAGSVLSQANERYLSQTVLDLQFSHAQRSGYELGKSVLRKIGNVASIAKSSPQHASLSVLRSPDIPSILVETGFLSNATEEQKLANPHYRKQIARAIYYGLVEYKRSHPSYPIKNNKTMASSPEKIVKMENENKSENKSVSNKIENNKKDKTEKNKVNKTPNEANSVNSNANYHIVEKDQTLYSIARMYKTTPEKLSQLNNIKENKIVVGKKLKIK